MDSIFACQFSHDSSSDEFLSMFKDPDPFLCDVANVIESCMRDETSPELGSHDDGSVDIFSYSNSTGSSSSGKKMSRKVKNKTSPHRHYKSYVCDWCDRKASFRSGQGLRFHKTLRCPRREAHLGQNFFKCSVCSKAFVTTKGLEHHRQELHPEKNGYDAVSD